MHVSPTSWNVDAIDSPSLEGGWISYPTTWWAIETQCYTFCVEDENICEIGLQVKIPEDKIPEDKILEDKIPERQNPRGRNLQKTKSPLLIILMIIKTNVDDNDC